VTSDAGLSVVVSAPTGAGKTAIAEAAAISVLARGQRVIYTTPLKVGILCHLPTVSRATRLVRHDTSFGLLCAAPSEFQWVMLVEHVGVRVRCRL
jgi:ERCC4-related helicase